MCLEDCCDGIFVDGMISVSVLFLLLIIIGIVVLALIPVYIDSMNSNTNPGETSTDQKFRITASSFNQNHNLFAAGLSKGEIFIWDLVNHEKRAFNTQGQTSSITGLKFVENQIVSTSIDGILRIWDVATGQSIRSVDLSIFGPLNTIELGPNNHIFVGSENGRISVFTDTNPIPVTALIANAANPVRFLGRLANGQIVAGSENAIRVYTFETSTKRLILARTINTPNNVNIKNMFVTDNTIISSSSNSLFVHNSNDGSLIKTVPIIDPNQSFE